MNTSMSAEELRQRLERAEWFINSQGYRRCDIAACNCPYWHGGNASERLREIADALREAGCRWEGTILKTLQATLAGMESGR